MRKKYIATMIVASFLTLAGVSLATQDRFALKSPNGIAFSEFQGYETWQSVAPSQTEDGLKVILGNAVAIDAYKKGIPAKHHSRLLPVLFRSGRRSTPQRTHRRTRRHSCPHNLFRRPCIPSLGSVLNLCC
jgi:hypothetical protein